MSGIESSTPKSVITRSGNTVKKKPVSKNVLGKNLPVRPPLYKNMLSLKFETGSYFLKTFYKNILYTWANKISQHSGSSSET